MRKRLKIIGTIALFITSLFILIKVSGEEGATTLSDKTEEEKLELEAFQSAEKLYNNEKYDMALKAYKDVMTKFRNGKYYEKAQFRVGDCLFSKNEYRLARTAYLIFISNNRSSQYIPDAYYKIADSYLKENDFDKALEQYKYAFDNFPSHKRGEKTLMWIADYYHDRKNYDESVYYFKKMTDWFPDERFTDRAYFMLALSHFYLKNYAQTRKAINKLMRIFPVSDYIPKGYMLLGDSYVHLAEYELKKQAYLNVLAREPLNKLAFIRLGDLYKKLHLYSQALDMYDKGLQPVFEDPFSKYVQEPGDSIAEVKPTINDVAFKNDLFRNTFLERCACLLRMGKMEQAKLNLDLFISKSENKNDLWKAYQLYGDMLYAKSEYGGAVDNYNKISDVNFLPLTSLYKKGIAHTRLQNYTDAISALNNVLRKWDDKQSSEINISLCHFALGEAYFNEKQYESAIEAYTMVKDVDDDYISYKNAFCYWNLNKYKKAGELLKPLIGKFSNKYYALQTSDEAYSEEWQKNYLNYLNGIVGYPPF